MINGRHIRMFRDLLLAYVFCVAIAVLIPLEFWRDLGQGGTGLLTLVVAGLITGAVTVRHRTPKGGEPVNRASASQVTINPA
jgi:hypothetical protein